MNAVLISLIATFTNLGLAALKLLIGLFSHSVALVAEGLHSSLDIFSSLITYFGVKVAQKPADKKHPYGYERYESLVSLIIVILLGVSAVFILKEGLANIFNQKEMALFSFWGIVIMAISAATNEIMARLKYRFGSKFGSLALISDAEHSRADVISSLAVLGGLFLVKFYPLADSILAILVALYIFYEAYQLGREVIDSVVDTANPDLEEKIKEILTNMKLNFSSLRTRKIGASNFAEISLLVPPQARANEVSALTKKVEDKLTSLLPELKQITISVNSHDFSESVIIPKYGKRLCFRQKTETIGPKKQGERIVVPLKNGDIAQSFGAEKYLLVDIDQTGKILHKTQIKNPYYEKSGMSHGIKFLKAVSADKVFAKYIGKGAKQNLKDLGIEIHIVAPNLTVKDLDYASTKKK